MRYLREHLEGCNPCRIVVDNIRQTIGLYQAERRYELPPALHERLSRALRERWKASTTKTGRSSIGPRRGDFAAVESLLLKYERQVYAVGRRIVGQHQDAEEVAQQTFLSVIEHLGSFARSLSFARGCCGSPRTTPWPCCGSGRSAPARRSTTATPTTATRGFRIPSSSPSGARRPRRLPCGMKRGATSMRPWPSSTKNTAWCSCSATSRGSRPARRPTSWASASRRSRCGCCRARLMLRERLTRLFGDESTRVAPHDDHDGDATN